MEILQAKYKVSEFPILRKKHSIKEIWSQVSRHDLVFGWFASWHTFFPMLFARFQRKSAVLVSGGYDLANLPKIGYGSQRGGLKKWVARWTLKLASVVVVNSQFSHFEAINNARVPSKKIHVIYHGVPDPLGKLPEKPAHPLVITVGNVEEDNLFRKGHLPFARASLLLPDVPFLLIGKARDMSGRHLRDQAGGNFKLTGFIGESELYNYYKQANVYVQASLHEAFGMSVAEAMLGGCVPVVSRNGALPEVVGDTGIILDAIQPEFIAAAIRQAINYTNDQRQLARERILSLFPLEKRKKELLDLVSQLA